MVMYIYKFSYAFWTGDTHSRACSYSCWNRGEVGTFGTSSTHCCNQRVICESRIGGNTSTFFCAWLLPWSCYSTSIAFTTRASRRGCASDGKITGLVILSGIFWKITRLTFLAIWVLPTTCRCRCVSLTSHMNCFTSLLRRSWRYGIVANLPQRWVS